MFLNTIEFGSNTYGIKVASNTFFNKDPIALNFEESAVMVAMVNKPTKYNPQRNPQDALEKRNQILRKIAKYNIITNESCDSLCAQPIKLDYTVDTHLEGLATYFRSYIRDFLLQWCNENGYDLWEDGLRIYTTLDSRIQAYAEKSLAQNMDTLQYQFIQQWNGKNPWVDDDGNELKDYISMVVKRTDHYK